MVKGAMHESDRGAPFYASFHVLLLCDDMLFYFWIDVMKKNSRKRPDLIFKFHGIDYHVKAI